MRATMTTAACLLALILSSKTAAFSSISNSKNSLAKPPGGFATTTTTTNVRLYGATTVEAPTREKTDTDRSTRRQSYDDDDFANMENDGEYPDLEYLIDAAESREMEDPFHILLMGSTFEKPKITVGYVAGSLEYVLNMPYTEGKELSAFAKEEGMSCLGTWPREKCLSLGKKLQVRDIVCRVVPFCEGGQRGWQAKDASESSSSNSNNNAESFR